MNILRVNHYTAGFVATLFAIFLSFFAEGPFNDIEQILIKGNYHARGEHATDTSVVILYLGNDDIADLGDLPLKRSYYALLVKALSEMGAKAVGFDIAFTERNTQFPEYDRLLASVVRASGKTVLSAYFRSLGELENGWRTGDRPDLPFPALLEGAAGVGHTNLTVDLNIPTYIRDNKQLFPAFGVELLRVGMGISRTNYTGSRTISFGNGLREIQADEAGEVTPNFPGGTESLRMFPVVDVLKSYDAIQSGRKPKIPASAFSGKYIIVGVIAEGRSSFLQTPFSPHYPAIGIHAVFLDNALHGDFLKKSPAAYPYILALLVGIICTFIMKAKKETVAIAGALGLVFFCLLLSCLLFAYASITIPVIPASFTVIAVTAGMAFYRHQAVKTELNTLVRDRENIEKTLQEKENRLAVLEKQLHSSQEDQRAYLFGEIQSLKSEVARLKAIESDLTPAAAQADPQASWQMKEFGGIVYRDPGPMAEAVEMTKKISESDVTVLLLGESGTGKELIARAIHQFSRRRSRPFVAVNCGALAETLLESELFGHERGAFTGAVKEKKGRFEVAEGGTIFLDEIGEVTEVFQLKLLRILQDGTYERVGGNQMLKVDVRIIAATNRDLKQAVNEKQFREDLYYRLNVFPIHLPPLRERVLDIPLLAEHFIREEFAGIQCSDAVMKALRQHQWKGNVRELQSIIRRASLLAKADGRTMLRMNDLPVEMKASLRASGDIEEQIISSLRHKKFTHNAISETADELGGLNRGTVAEYFRGFCFRTFSESGWSFTSAVEAIAATVDEDIRSRVHKKLLEYLQNALEFMDHSKQLDEVLSLSKPKFKNLPQRYHPFLNEIIVSAYRKYWSITA